MKKVTLITGATSGIGEALAYQLAERKHHLLLVARNELKLAQLCLELAHRYKIQADYVVADLSDVDTCNYVFVECQRKNLFVNRLINNAGSGSSGEFAKNQLHTELDILQLNNQSMVALCRLFLPAMIQQKEGYIVNVGSMASFFPSPYMAVYAASKAFVRSFTEALTEECKPYGVNVLLFCPGLTKTNFMNTSATNNDWGKALVKGVKAQSPMEVASELVEAMERKKTFHISGRRNAIAAKIASFIPNATIAGIFARRKRRDMGLSF